ncbi:unnamed protein product, partial [marine sediment metagenome]
IHQSPELIERDSVEFKQLHEPSLNESGGANDKMVYGWNGPPPTLKDQAKSMIIVKKADNGITSKPKPKQSIKPPKLDNKKVIDKIVKNKIPDNFKRQNLILGNFQIYGAAVKKAKVFGKEVEETEWEPINSIPEGPIELNDRTIRLYVDVNSGSIEGIEILQKLETTPIIEKIIEKKEKINYNSWTVNKLKLYCKENDITIPSSYRKAQIINLIQSGPPLEINKQPLNYNKWTVKQLKEYCNENHLKVLASYRKADLVKLVKEYYK